MRYQNVCLEAFACTLPERIVTSAEIEAHLAPIYRRLGLPEGRLELITGISTRRFWPPGTVPSDQSVLTAEKALRIAGLDKRHVGALVHGSVCRDYLEPATASGVHCRLGLPAECMVYDVSNACLGLMNGLVQVANMIELGQIRAGIVVGTEDGRPLVENTIRWLNEATSLTRNEAKRAIASLTIGSGSAAIVLADRELSRTGNRLLGGAVRIRSSACRLCISGHDASIGGDWQPLMWTDSDALMRQGIHAAKETFPTFLEATGWAPNEIHRSFCHQIGPMHRKLLFEKLGLDVAIDYPTVEFLGNTGSVALPITAALGVQLGCVKRGDHVALWGIGSGINVVALGVDWQRSLVDDSLPNDIPVPCAGQPAREVDSAAASAVAPR
jgi:3-oxoacyl-[acyl-carrier-protein] synthase-3